MCACREQWKRCSEEEKAGQVLTVVEKLVNEVDEVQENLETRKKQLLLENGLEWRTFRSYVDIACMYMVGGDLLRTGKAVSPTCTDMGVTEDIVHQGPFETALVQSSKICGSVRGE